MQKTVKFYPFQPAGELQTKLNKFCEDIEKNTGKCAGRPFARYIFLDLLIYMKWTTWGLLGGWSGGTFRFFR